MKTVKCLLFLIVPSVTYGQYQYGFVKELFFSRQPSARAEAMGQSYASIDGDLTTSFYNPAGIATIKGIEVNSTYVQPGYYLTMGYYRYFAAGYNIHKYLQVAVSQNHFDFGKTEIIGTTTTPFTETNTLTIASQPLKNLYIGLNTTYLRRQVGFGDPATSIHFDFGVIKKFEFLKKESSSHSASIGSSLTNFSYSKSKWNYMGKDYTSNLPVIARIGFNYQYNLDKHWIIKKLNALKILVQGQFQDVLNSDYETAIGGGGEITLLELISLRGGYYKNSVYNYGYPSVNYSSVGGLTYGFGLQIPLHKLTKIPLNINVDYTSLPQPLYSNAYTFGNFNTYNLRLNWIFKNKTKT